MAYKGDDLDLRAPQGRSSGAPSAAGMGRADDEMSVPARQRLRQSGYHQNGSARSPALYVDETLLACCNHAYDLASANGSREVLLEHLVHAMTRVPEAAQVLENRGVHVMALRRESAAVIANDLPISPTDSGGAARASSDFDAVLHLAAANARLRSERPTSVRDVLFVLMNYDRQSSGIDLLRRHWATWQQDEQAEEPAPRPAPPLQPRIDLRHAYDPGLLAQDTFPPRIDRFAEARLESLIGNLHEALMAQRAEAQSLRSALAERLNRLEKAIEVGRHDNGTSAVEIAITARLQRLEKMQESILAQRLNLAPLEASINERLSRLEKSIEAARHEQAKPPAAMIERLQGVERTIEHRLTHFTDQATTRMQRMEEALASAADATPSGLIDRMQSMEKSFEGKISDGLQMWTSIGDRLQGLERSLQAHRADIAQLQSGGAQMHSILSERTQAMERILEGWRQESAATSARLPGPLLERMGNLESMLMSWREDMMTSPGGGGEIFGVLFERLQSLERAITTSQDEAVRLARTNEAAVAEVRAGLTRLGSAQQGLSAAIDQWRLDNTGDLGIISNRLEAIEHSSVRPMELLESLNARAQAASLNVQTSAATPVSTSYGSSGNTQTTVRVARTTGQRRGFWRWLFGLG